MTELNRTLEAEKGIRMAMDKLNEFVQAMLEIGVDNTKFIQAHKNNLDEKLDELAKANLLLIEANMITSCVQLEQLFECDVNVIEHYRNLVQNLMAKETAYQQVIGKIFLHSRCQKEYSDLAAVAKGSLKLAGIDPDAADEYLSGDKPYPEFGDEFLN